MHALLPRTARTRFTLEQEFPLKKLSYTTKSVNVHAIGSCILGIPIVFYRKLTEAL